MEKWAKNNKIKINTSKCVHITFTLNKWPISKIKFNNQELQALRQISRLIPRQQTELEKAHRRKDQTNKNNYKIHVLANIKKF